MPIDSSVSMPFVLNSHGLMKRRIQASAVAAMSDAVKKLDTKSEHARDRLQQSSGRFAGSTTVRLAVNMDGAAVRVAAI